MGKTKMKSTHSMLLLYFFIGLLLLVAMGLSFQAGEREGIEIRNMRSEQTLNGIKLFTNTHGYTKMDSVFYTLDYSTENGDAHSFILFCPNGECYYRDTLMGIYVGEKK